MKTNIQKRKKEYQTKKANTEIDQKVRKDEDREKEALKKMSGEEVGLKVMKQKDSIEIDRGVQTNKQEEEVDLENIKRKEMMTNTLSLTEIVEKNIGEHEIIEKKLIINFLNSKILYIEIYINLKINLVILRSHLLGY